MKNPIKSAFEASLRNRGFVKQASTWYLDTNETVLVVNLQKSEFGQMYYVNLGIWFKALGEFAKPREELCHIRMRLDSLAGNEIEHALNQEDLTFSDEDRHEIIFSCISDVAIPFLMSSSTIAGAKLEFEAGRLKGGMVHKKAKELFLAH